MKYKEEYGSFSVSVRAYMLPKIKSQEAINMQYIPFYAQVQKQADHSYALFIPSQTEASHLSHLWQIVPEQEGINSA